MENNYTKNAKMASAPRLIICISEFILWPTPALQQITNHAVLQNRSAQDTTLRGISSIVR
jgi:hypothetical protein